MALDSLNEESQMYDYMRFTWADIHGISRCRSVPQRHMAATFRDGLGIWIGLSAIGIRSEIPVELLELTQGSGNMILRPVPGTTHPIPWACQGDPAYRVGEILCETHSITTGQPLTTCSRFLARQQLDRLIDLTGLKLYSTFEAEFMLYNKNTKKRVGDGLPAFCLSLEMSRYEKLLYDMERYLQASGVDVEAITKECPPAQFEFNPQPQFGVTACDQMFSLKEGVKEIAAQHGLIATFMPKPGDGLGNGLHFNFSLWKDGDNVFHDPESKDKLSDIGKHWMAGILKHSPALTALFSPTPNCYRRMQPPLVPLYANWEHQNRYVSIRVRTESPSRTFMENRLPSGCANPYLVLAGTVAAGLDGILNKLVCPPSMDPAAVKLPTSLSEAIKALEEDSVIRGALGEDFMAWWTMIKRCVEIRDIESIEDETQRMDREMEEYLEIM